MLSLVVGAVSACDGAPSTRGASVPSPAPARASSATDTAPLQPALEAADDEEAVADGGTAITIGFDWGPPCRVPAIQDVERDGVRSRFAFDVVLERVADRLVTRLDKMRVIALPEGADQRGPAIERVLAALEGSIPSVVVAATGESEGAVDLDRAIDAAIGVVTNLTGDDPATAAVVGVLRSPQWRAAFAQKAGELWNTWVGAWTGRELEPDTVQRATYDLPSAVGTFEDVPITVSHHGSVRGAPGLVLLSLEQTIDGPELAALMGGMVRDLAAKAGSGDLRFEVRTAKKTDRSIVAIEPRLGRPHRARHEVEIAADGATRRTSRDTAFDWSRAVGCVASSPASASPSGASSAP